jgi:hypothetical protein
MQRQSSDEALWIAGLDWRRRVLYDKLSPGWCQVKAWRQQEDRLEKVARREIEMKGLRMIHGGERSQSHRSSLMRWVGYAGLDVASIHPNACTTFSAPF